MARPPVTGVAAVRSAIRRLVRAHSSLIWNAVRCLRVKASRFVEVRSGKGSHLLLKHPTSGKEVWGAVHTKKDAALLGNRILREAGVE